ncbi:MAG: hypothetical protein ACHQ49_18465 [Elusimicrobiota bacterium]
MIRTALVAAAAFALASPVLGAAAAAARPAKAAAPAVVAEATGMISFSLVDALTSIHQPQLAGIFSFVEEKNAPFAFADFIARDKKSMKLYLKKLDADVESANGLTEWDHEVCASLINLYGSPMAATFGVPDAKTMKQINDAMLSRTISLEEIVSKRKK